jgi:hypothetical protein
MNPLLRGILVFILLSLVLTYAINMSWKDFLNASIPGKINTILLPILVFSGAAYRYSLTFDKDTQTCLIEKGLVFLNKKTIYSFNDLTALNYRVYDYNQKEEANQFSRGIPRRTRADFGFFFNGKLFQLEKSAPQRGVETLYLAFTAFFPRDLYTQ